MKARWILAVVGTGMIAIAMLSFALGASELSIPFVAGGLAIAGLGLGVSQPSLSAIVGNAVDEHNFGIASSAIQMTSSIGAVAGISVLTALTARTSSGEIFYYGYLLGAGIAGLGFVATLFIQHRSYAMSDVETHT